MFTPKHFKLFTADRINDIFLHPHLALADVLHQKIKVIFHSNGIVLILTNLYI